MIVKLLIEHHLEFLSLKASSRGSFESSLVKMSNCWKSHVMAQIIYFVFQGTILSETPAKTSGSCLEGSSRPRPTAGIS